MNFFHIDGEGKINILGFSMHSDDLLLLAILFFLYMEKVDDTFLYIFLVLLLLS